MSNKYNKYRVRIKRVHESQRPRMFLFKVSLIENNYNRKLGEHYFHHCCTMQARTIYFVCVYRPYRDLCYHDKDRGITRVEFTRDEN